MAGLARRAVVFNLTAPGANTGIVSGGVTPLHPGSFFRVTVVLETASVFNHTITDSTGSPVVKTNGLNSSVALAAGDEYVFDCAGALTPTAGTYTAPLIHNWTVETDGVIALLVVDEMRGIAS